MSKELLIERAVLVYQAGIANVFQVREFSLTHERRGAKRLYQGCFREAAFYAMGLKAAGTKVATAACNRAGDIVDSEWSDNLDEQPFSDKFIIVS